MPFVIEIQMRAYTAHNDRRGLFPFWEERGRCAICVDEEPVEVHDSDALDEDQSGLEKCTTSLRELASPELKAKTNLTAADHRMRHYSADSGFIAVISSCGCRKSGEEEGCYQELIMDRKWRQTILTLLELD
jgi:hypothetical protein